MNFTVGEKYMDKEFITTVIIKKVTDSKVVVQEVGGFDRIAYTKEEAEKYLIPKDEK